MTQGRGSFQPVVIHPETEEAVSVATKGKAEQALLEKKNPPQSS